MSKAPRESTPIDIELEEEIRELLATRLVAESPLSEILHPLLALVAGAMAWPHASHVDVVLWFSAVTFAAGGRAFLRVRAARSRDTSEAKRQAVRIGVAALGVAWGFGIMLVASDLPPAALAWVAVIIAGLVSGATMTLLPDPLSFYMLATLALGPLAASVLVDPNFQSRGLAAFVIVTYGLSMTAFFRRSHRALLKQFQTAKRLEITERAAGNERHVLDALIEHAPNAIAVLDETGNVLRVNKAFEMMFGWPAAECLNRSLRDLIVFKDDAEIDPYIRKVAGGERAATETRRRKRDGSAVWVQASAAPVTMFDSRVNIIMYADITEARRAREAERQLVRIIEATTDHVAITAPDGRMKYMNAAGRTMLGIDPRTDVTSLNFVSLAPRRLKDAAQDTLATLNREGTWSGEMEFMHRDGHEVPVSVVALAQRNEVGAVEALAFIARDITGEVASREALRHARDAAEEATRAKSAFLANTSHEIRTPLNGILGMVELLLDTELTPAQRRSTELIASSGEALLATMNDLLDFSKIEANQLELEAIPFDLHHVLHSAARLFMPRANEHGIELITDLAADVPQFVKGDPHRLRQVLSNLVGNAVKFTHQGEVVLSARRAGDQITFTVSDSGIGIAQDHIDRIFEPFRQVDASTTRQYGGTGLGLSIARRLVDLMGGTLGVTSTVGEGSRFDFTVAMPAAPTPATAPSREMGLAGTRALVVDDHPINRRTISEMLRWAGCEVETASSAHEALKLARQAAKQSPFRLIVTDVSMPGRDGFQLAADIKADQQTAGARVMVLTSVGKRGDAEKSRNAGVAAYMLKPVSRVELVEAAVAALRETGEHALITRHSIDEARRKLRVLLTEDNPVNQEVAASMLRKRGHDVIVAGDGNIAVAFIRKREKFDVILMDLQMPELDGHLATKEIRKLGCKTPIIALTANALPGERERCLEAGMNDHLSKPFKAHELFAVVEGWEPRDPTPMPFRAAASEPPIDLASFHAMLADAGIESAGDQMLHVFLDYSNEKLGLLNDAVRSGMLGEVERIAHALKSSAGTVMAGPLAALFTKIEAAGQAADTKTVNETIDAINAEHARVVAYLKPKLTVNT